MPHELRTFQSGHVTLSYEVFGKGDRVVVYLHGLLLDSHVNRNVAEYLSSAGYRVLLLDLPGHGASDKPLHASEHRMDAYAHHVAALLDEVGVDKAVVGGLSLGADVALFFAHFYPERTKGLIVEMPVLEGAVPFAAMVFVPLLLAAHYIQWPMRQITKLARLVPRQYIGPADMGIGPLLLGPDEMAAVLHGLLVGPIAPSATERMAITAPVLVIAHRSDRLHPFGDAKSLAGRLPNGELIEATSIVEMRLAPNRLRPKLTDFLDRIWSTPAAAEAAS